MSRRIDALQTGMQGASVLESGSTPSHKQ